MYKGNSVVLGQRVHSVKLALAKQFRRKMTVAERTLWNALRRNQVDGHHFRRQQVIDGFIVDFYCHSVRLVIEVDGRVHASRTAVDHMRDRALRCRGLRVLRVKNEAILKNLPKAIAMIRRRCRKGDRGGVPPSQ
jgi:very-short-patch-repair endonuclease